MQKLNFSININAQKEKVWKVLFDDATYREWTSEFMPGSYAETDWKEGSKAKFMSPDGSGLVSRIAKSIPNKYLSINHLGFVKNGIEDTESEAVKDWAGAMENYSLSENNGITELKVDMDSTDQYKDYFSKTWPKALEKVKELSENN